MAYSQADRYIQVSTPLGKDKLLLEGFRGSESMSAPFSFELDLLSTERHIDPASLLKKNIAISIAREDGSLRYINGMVSRFSQLESEVYALSAFRAEIVPWVWFLALSTDCRIFQNLSVPDIVEKVVKGRGFSDYRLSLTRTYSPREYCVQYRETDLNFVSRLLEEEGIFYFFEHSADKHTMVIADSSSAIELCTLDPTISFGKPAQWQKADVVTSLSLEQKVHTDKISLTDYNFEQPSLDLAAEASAGASKWGEGYDYPGDYKTHDDGSRYTTLRLEERETSEKTVAGGSNSRGFASGYRFQLEDFEILAANTTYTLVSLKHTATTNAYRTDQDEEMHYANEFVAIPHSVKYRPPRTSLKPVIHGCQTAVVTGTAGSEIYVDNYGRIKVQFPWDRLGHKDENSSCWIRVSQSWAGKQWGAIMNPRIGQEVIVSFLEGDPDRPIVTGRVYNAEQMPPYDLPANSTQAGVKSRSSKDGTASDFNELRFEDKTGDEDVYFHAQKDLHSVVEHDEDRKVGNDRSTGIKNNESLTVDEGNRTITVSQGNQTTTIKMGNMETTLNEGSKTLTISLGNETTKINAGKSEKEAMQSIELKVGQSSVKLDQMGVTIQGMMIKIQGEVQVQIKGTMTQINGDAMLTCKGGIVMIN